MRKYLLILLATICSTAFAADIQPTDASLKELLTVTQSQKMIDNMFGQIQSMMSAAEKQSLQGKPVTPDIQKILDSGHEKALAVMKEEMSWEKLEPLYIRIYKASFSQKEVDDMLAFYQTPGGQAVIQKMPVVLHNTMTEIQQMMGPMMQKMRAIQQQSAVEIQSAEPKPAK